MVLRGALVPSIQCQGLQVPRSPHPPPWGRRQYEVTYPIQYHKYRVVLQVASADPFWVSVIYLVCCVVGSACMAGRVRRGARVLGCLWRCVALCRAARGRGRGSRWGFFGVLVPALPAPSSPI